MKEISPELKPSKATANKRSAARFDRLAQNGAEIQFTCKEAIRRKVPAQEWQSGAAIASRPGAPRKPPAISSAEAELFALTSGALQALGFMTLLEEFGHKVDAVLRGDASAAIGIVRCCGLSMLQHLNACYLRLQDQLK